MATEDLRNNYVEEFMQAIGDAEKALSECKTKFNNAKRVIEEHVSAAESICQRFPDIDKVICNPTILYSREIQKNDEVVKALYEYMRHMHAAEIANREFEEADKAYEEANAKLEHAKDIYNAHML